MSSTSGSGFELPQAYYAPHREWGVASPEIKNHTFDRKKVWLEIEKLLKGGVTENDRQWLTDALSEITIYTSNPSSLPTPADKATMGEYERQIRAFIATIDAAKAVAPAAPEAESQSRNDFERALASWRFPERYKKYRTQYKFGPPDTATSAMLDAHRIQYGLDASFDEEAFGKMMKKSFIFTRIFRTIINGIDWSTPTLKLPKNALSFTGENVNYSDTEQLLANIDDSVSGEDAALAREFQKDMLSTVAVLGEMIEMFSEIKSAAGELRTQQSAAKMKEIYQKMITFGNIDRLSIFHDLPPLMDDDGNLSTKSIGEIFFNGVQEAISLGHDWVVDPSTGWVREHQDEWEPGTPEKKGKNWVIVSRRPGGSKVPAKLYSPVFRGDATKSLFPENEAGAKSNDKTQALADLRARLAGYDLQSTSKLTGDISAAFTYQLLVVWGEADAQDIVYDATRGRGAPVGWSYLGRAENSGIYAQKTAEENAVDSKVNPFIVGRQNRAVVPYNKFAATSDGKTLEQAILTSRNWKEIYDKMEHYATDRLSLAYSNHIVRGFDQYALAESIKEGETLFNIATLNLQEGQVKIQTAALQALFDRIRNALEYHEGTDLVGTAILSNASELIEKAFIADRSTLDGERRFKERKLPSEEFYEIVVVDENYDFDRGILTDPNTHDDFEQHIIPKGRYITRFPTHYNITPVRIAAWLQDPDFDQNAGDSRAYQHAISFNRPVMRWNPGTGLYEETGQKDKVILIQPRKKDLARYGRDAKQVREYKNDPKTLTQRLLTEYVLEITALPSDIVSKLKKEDWLPLGLFFSAEIRHKYLKGHYGRPSDRLRAIIGEQFKHITGQELEFIMREDPGITGRDLYSENQFMEVLALIGHGITLEDWTNTVNVLNSIIGLPRAPIAGKGGGGSGHDKR